MSRILLCFLYFSGVFSASKVVKIVQEPANYGGVQSQQARSPQMQSTLKPFRKQAPFSGPYHLKKLYGKCFLLADSLYKYELCPFFNITQHEQTWRWNAFQGILGIWKEWSIVNNTFEAMLMTDGDQCPGNTRRESKVYFKCANSNTLVSVKEPSTCKYEVTFKTPLACPVDAFLVYPSLSPAQKKEWEAIEESLYHEEITRQGYQKLRRRLFVRAGLMSHPKQLEAPTNKGKDNVHNLKSEKNAFVPKTKFNTKEECFLAYSDLLHEFLKLQQLFEKQNISRKASTVPQISNVQARATSSLKARGDSGVLHGDVATTKRTASLNELQSFRSPGSTLTQTNTKKH